MSKSAKTQNHRETCRFLPSKTGPFRATYPAVFSRIAFRQSVKARQEEKCSKLTPNVLRRQHDSSGRLGRSVHPRSRILDPNESRWCHDYASCKFTHPCEGEAWVGYTVDFWKFSCRSLLFMVTVGEAFSLSMVHQCTNSLASSFF